jgi:hypothetical protein
MLHGYFADKSTVDQQRKQHLQPSSSDNPSKPMRIIQEISIVVAVFWIFDDRNFFLSAIFSSAQVIGASSKAPMMHSIVANHCHT